jgi:hypothetical protein
MRINALGNTATDFASDDYIAIDGTTNGSRKMKNDSLLKLTAQNALAGNVAPAFDPTKPNDAGGYAYYKDEIVAYKGATYKFKVNHSSGAWNAAEVDSYTFSDVAKRFSVITNNDYALAVIDSNNVFLFGIHHDGSVSFQKGVPAPINRKFIQVAESIELLRSQLDGKVDVVDGKSLITTLFANSVSFVSNNDYVFAFLDASDKLVFGVRCDGTLDSDVVRDYIVSIVSSTFKGAATEQYVDDAVQTESSRASRAEADLQSQISSISPTIVEGGENNPDEFYLTSVDDKITLKDLPSSILSYGITWVNPNNVSFSTAKTIYIISSFVDLNEESISVPADSVLLFCGGCLDNGTIVGNETTLIYSAKIFGDSLTLAGTWKADFICSDMLQSPFSVNALKKLNVLLSDGCFNSIVIKRGSYYFKPTADSDFLLSLKNNTELRIDGEINVVPNGFPHNYVVYLGSKKHLKVYGCGKIYGDTDEHDYTTTQSSHEWCHAVKSNAGCSNVEIEGLTFENCAGDGACLSGSHICLYDLTISHCGRQGISLEMCSDVLVYNCKISDIYRTAPKAAVDIEPWVDGARASNIKLLNIEISECTGILFIKADNVSVENVIATDCTRLFYGQLANDVIIKNIVANNSGSTPSDFIDVKNNCSRVSAECLRIADEQGTTISMPNIRLGFGCTYNSNSLKPVAAAQGSICYELGKYIQYNGSSWVNMDGSNL